MREESTPVPGSFPAAGKKEKRKGRKDMSKEVLGGVVVGVGVQPSKRFVCVRTFVPGVGPRDSDGT
jgi:hypothetical protein